jgi:cobalt-zinc-cadmium efflux system membrane fusion protein
MRTPALATIVIAAAVTFAGGCGREQPQQRAPRAAPQAVETHPEERNAIHLSEDLQRDLRIGTAQVLERPDSAVVTVLGEVAADQSRYAEITPPTAGQVVRVLVETDAPVARGMPLAELRSTDLGRARADLLSAEARRDLARQTLERKRSLAEERIVALREVQEAESVYRAAEADVRAATAALQARGIGDDATPADPSLYFVRSPIAGRVLDRRAVLGQYADQVTSLFTVADLARVWVIGQAFERDAVNVRAGIVAHITLAALPGQEFDGRVALVGRQVDPGSRTLPIRVEVANPSGQLRPGMSASMRLEVAGQARTILTVPAAALQRVGDGWLAFVPRGTQEFEMRPVGRGRDLANDVEVVSGLKAGETVVVDGAFLLKAEAEKRQGGGDEHGH